MGKVWKIKPRRVATPGAYSLEASLKSSSGNRKKKGSRGKKGKNTKEKQTTKRKDRGAKKRDREEDSESDTRDTPKKDTPSKGRRPKRKGTARKDNYRTRYTPEQMAQAVRLVMEDGYSVAAAAKETGVPRMTLNDRMKTVKPVEDPKIGRPQEISKAAEKAIVDCLCLCAEFQYPMNKRDVCNLVQAYCVENGVETRWKDSKPGKDWVVSFQKRWSHKVKLRRPRAIKRSRAAVSPQIVRDFFEKLGPNVTGILATHFFNYDETNLKDDPGIVKDRHFLV
jgi:hypothetical protein